MYAGFSNRRGKRHTAYVPYSKELRDRRVCLPAPLGFRNDEAGPVRPAVLNTAFWLYLAAIVVGLIATFVNIPAVIATSNTLATRTSNSSAVAGIAIAVDVISGLIGAALWVLFLIFLRRGHGWARWVLAALTVVGLISVATSYGVAAIHELLAIVAAVLTFLPAANSYLRHVALRRKAQRGA